MKMRSFFTQVLAVCCSLIFAGSIQSAPPSKMPGTFPGHPAMKHRDSCGMPSEVKDTINKKGKAVTLSGWLKGASSGDKCCLMGKKDPAPAKACCKTKKDPAPAKACCKTK